MLIAQPLDFISHFVDNLNRCLTQKDPAFRLSRRQQYWLAFCLMGILMTNTVCWSKFERSSLGHYSVGALSWMFRLGKISWDSLLAASILNILVRYGITEGVLVIDDSDKKRSKITKRIPYTHKIKDKSSGGYFNGQSLVFLVLVTPKISFPVGFAFYQPDPVWSQWKQKEKVLRKNKVPKSQRPPKPEHNPNFPTKQELALRLLSEFQAQGFGLKIRCILADALYGTPSFVDEASELFDGTQVISQIRYNQNVRYRNRKRNVRDFFNSYTSVPQSLLIRGQKEVSCEAASARLFLDAHGKKRFIIALKYEGEENFRFLIASDLSWRTQDILQAYTLRWLVEVFIQDWKGHEGWGQLTKQPDEEGSSRSLILSLLLDHCLLLHPDQLAQIENNLPAYTVGSLQEKSKVQGILELIQNCLQQGNPKETMEQLVLAVENIFELRTSDKHMVGRDLGKLEPTPSLKYRALQQ